jgi:hypothetical protein
VAPDKKSQNSEEILVEFAEGENRFIPISWTDAGQSITYPTGMRFPIEKLIRLRELLDDLLEQQSILPAERTGQQSSGGRNGYTKGDVMGAPQSGTTQTRDCGAGSHAVGVFGSTDGGAR